MQHLQKLNLLVEEIEDKIFIVVRPGAARAIHLVSHPQLRFLQALESGIDPASLGFSGDQLDQMRNILENSNIIGEPIKKITQKNLNFWFHLTDACTLKCTYCPIPKQPNHMSPALMQSVKRKLVEAVRLGKLTSVTLRLSGGEPLMRFAQLKDFIPDIRQALFALGCQFRVAFLTNLTILNQEIIDFIKRERIGVSVSLDGLAEFHDQARVFPSGRGSFEIVSQNIKRLQENGIDPFIMTVMTNENMSAMPAFVEYLIANDLRFRIQLEKGRRFDWQESTRHFDRIFQIIDAAIDRGYKYHYANAVSDLNFTSGSNNACGAGVSTAMINAQGDLYICHHVYDGEPFANIGDPEDMMALMARSGADQYHAKPNKCHDCQYRRICAGACPIDKQANCELMQFVIPRVYKLAAKVILRRVLANRAARQKCALESAA